VKRITNTAIALWLVSASATHLGCAPQAAPADIGHHIGSPQSLLRLNRVALVELEVDDDYAQIGRDMTEALFQAVQQKRLFHLRVVDKDDPLYKDLPLPFRQPCALQELAAVRKSLGCNAVLFGSITHFRPYPGMRRGKLLWAVDHTWDTSEKRTELRIRDFFTDQARSGYDPIHWRIGLLSPRAFEKFVAYEAAGTLPGRPPTNQTAKPQHAGPVRETLGKITEISKRISRNYRYSRQ
jgi:hypothetical protein